MSKKTNNQAFVDLSDESIIYFIDHHEIRNEKGERISFEDRRFLFEPMSDLARFQVHMKCGQIGGSVTMVIKTLWASKYKGWNVIHTFPSETDSNEFVETKTNEIIKNSPAFNTITGSLQRKAVDGRYIYYKGTISKTAMIMTSADLIVADEYDRSDIGVVNKMDSRLQASSYKGFWYLSNPSIEGAGVDAIWRKSDKKEWFVTCRNGHAHVLSWPDSIDMDREVYQCKECREELTDEDRRDGEWRSTATVPSKISGYHISLLMAPWVNAGEIIRKWNDGKDPEGFFNFVLGLPYSPGDTKISRTMILDNWTPQNIRTGNYYIGVDVGNLKHFVVGSEKGIVQVGTFTDWHDFDDLMQRYKPKVAVIDALPDNTMALYYKDKYREVYISYFSVDKETNKLVRYGEKDKQGIIQSDRNRVIDLIVNDLLHGKILFGLPADKNFQEYIKHCEAMRRQKVVNNRGVERFVWEPIEEHPDHFWFATVYYWLAKETQGTTHILSEQIRQPEAILNTSKGFISNIGEAIERLNYGHNRNI